MEPQLAGQLAELLLLTQHGQFGSGWCGAMSCEVSLFFDSSMINGPRLLANATLLAARRAVTASLKDEGTLELDCQPLQHYVSNPLKEGSSFFLEGVQRDSPPGSGVMGVECCIQARVRPAPGEALVCRGLRLGRHMPSDRGTALRQHTRKGSGMCDSHRAVLLYPSLCF